MILARALKQIGRNQTRNARNVIHGRPLTTPSFGSVTLDINDVDLARRQLDDRSDWDDHEIVARYEREFAVWNGSRYAFAFMSGRVALSACIYALGLRPGDEVIVPGYTCVVVSNAFHYVGVKIVYVDIELDTYGVDINDLSRKITPNTRAVLIQHLYGLVSRDYLQIVELARTRGIKVIEDCAHSTGATMNSVKVGNIGDVSFYSTEQSKIITTIQGGLAMTNDEKIAERLKYYCDATSATGDELTEDLLYNIIINYYSYKHPQRWWLADYADLIHGKHRLISTTAEEERGIKPSNYGMTMRAPIARIGLNQLCKIDHYNNRRVATARRWRDWCEKHGYSTPLTIQGSKPVFLRYPVLVEPEKKKDSRWAFDQLGMNIGVWYVSNLHPAPSRIKGCPNADKAVARCINLPCLID